MANNYKKYGKLAKDWYDEKVDDPIGDHKKEPLRRTFRS